MSSRAICFTEKRTETKKAHKTLCTDTISISLSAWKWWAIYDVREWFPSTVYALPFVCQAKHRLSCPILEWEGEIRKITFANFKNALWKTPTHEFVVYVQWHSKCYWNFKASILSFPSYLRCIGPFKIVWHKLYCSWHTAYYCSVFFFPDRYLQMKVDENGKSEYFGVCFSLCTLTTCKTKKSHLILVVFKIRDSRPRRDNVNKKANRYVRMF